MLASKSPSLSIIVANIGLTDTNDYVNGEETCTREKIRIKPRTNDKRSPQLGNILQEIPPLPPSYSPSLANNNE